MSHPARDPRSGIDGKAIASGRRLDVAKARSELAEVT